MANGTAQSRRARKGTETTNRLSASPPPASAVASGPLCLCPSAPRLRQRSLFEPPTIPSGIAGYVVGEEFYTASDTGRRGGDGAAMGGETIRPGDVVELSRIGSGRERWQPARVDRILLRGEAVWLDVVKLTITPHGTLQGGRFLLRVAGPAGSDRGTLNRVRLLKTKGTEVQRSIGREETAVARPFSPSPPLSVSPSPSPTNSDTPSAS